jgi:hypothetical protein
MPVKSRLVGFKICDTVSVTMQKGEITIEILAIKTTQTMIDSMKNTIDTFENNNHKISFQDNVTNDLLHELELHDLKLVRKIKLIGELIECRRERRRLKDENEQLLPLYEIVKQNENFKNQLLKANKRIINIANRQAIRDYTPRVRGETYDVATK